MTNKTGQSWTVNSDFTRDQFLEHVGKLYDQHKYVTFHWATGRQRSPKQRAALEVYCRMLGESLNDAGYDMRRVLKSEVEIPWNQETVKEYIWRPIQKLVTGDESTTQPDRDEYPEIFEVIYRHMVEKFGVVVAWPVKREDGE